MADIGEIEDLTVDDFISRCPPLLSEEPDWSRAIYANPPSHDFCTWLIIAELMRREHKAPGPLRVTLLLNQGQLGLFDFGNVGLLVQKGGKVDLPLAYSNEMLANVIRPAIEMIGGVNEPDMHVPVPWEQIKHHCEYGYFMGPLVEAAKHGFKVPRWQVPTWAKREVDDFLKGERPVVITLREAILQPERNSRLVDWIRFAESIRKDFPIIIVRDTARANSHAGEFRTYPRASTDIRVRAALYESAYCNLMVGNGPVTWCQFSESAPYLVFKQLVPELVPGGWTQGAPEGWWEYEHLRVGDQWPWASARQRMTWRDDTFEDISEEFERFHTLDGAS